MKLEALSAAAQWITAIGTITPIPLIIAGHTVSGLDFLVADGNTEMHGRGASSLLGDVGAVRLRVDETRGAGPVEVLTLRQSRVQILAVDLLQDLQRDCARDRPGCALFFVLEHRRDEVLDLIAAVLIGTGRYCFDEEPAAYAEALECAETVAAYMAAARTPWEAIECSSTSLTLPLAGGLPQRHSGATTHPSSREIL